jgi:hypothetical protein
MRPLRPSPQGDTQGMGSLGIKRRLPSDAANAIRSEKLSRHASFYCLVSA